MHNHSLKKSLMSTAVAMALMGSATPSLAISGVLFDQDGSGITTGDQRNVNKFTWAQIMIIAQKAFDNTTVPGTVSGAVVAGQGRLESLVGSTGATTNSNFTFVFSIDNVNAAKTGNGAGAQLTMFTDPGAVPSATPTATNYFAIYANAGSPDSTSNTILATGTGCFNCGTLILSGSTFIDNTLSSSSPATDAGGNVLTASLVGTGTSSIAGAGKTDQAGTPIVTRNVTTAAVGVGVNVGFADTNYFLTDISSFSLDIDFSTNLVDPFSANVFMQYKVAGDTTGGGSGQITPNFGTSVSPRLNDFACGAASAAPCDMIFASQSGSSSIFHSYKDVPEPASLALLGLGLAGLGGFVRRKKLA